MVGHTGDFGAAVKAVETIDACLGGLRQLYGRWRYDAGDRGSRYCRNDDRPCVEAPPRIRRTWCQRS